MAGQKYQVDRANLMRVRKQITNSLGDVDDRLKIVEAGGGGISASYLWSTTLTGDPTAAHLGTDNADVTLVTVLRVHKLTGGGNDISALISGLKIGSLIGIFEVNAPSGTALLRTNAAPQFNGDYFSLTVTPEPYTGMSLPTVQDAQLNVTFSASTSNISHNGLLDVTPDQHHAKRHDILDQTHHIYPAVSEGKFLRDDGSFQAVSSGGGDATDHNLLTGVTPDQHHPKDHDHKGLGSPSSSGRIPHTDLTDVLPDQHHPQVHDYNSHTGIPTEFPPSPHTHTHASTTGQTEDDHHPKIHSYDSHTGIPSEFPPSPHTHDHATLTNVLPDDHHAELHLLTSHTDVDTTENPLKHGHALWWDSVSGMWENRSAFLESFPTGLATGGELNIVAGQIEVVAGYGILVDAWTDPLSPPILSAIQWDTIQSAITAAPASAGSIVWFSMASTGVPSVPPQFGGVPLYTAILKQYAQSPNPSLARKETFLGVAIHNGTEWKEVSNPKVVNQSVETLRELLTAVLPLSHIIGGGATHSQPVFQIRQDEGVIWEQNRNWHNDKSDPNRETLPALNPIQFRYVNRDFTSVGALTPTVNPALYDNGTGAPVPVVGTANTCTIQRLYLDPANNYWMLWGQNTYPNFTTALANINADNYNTIIPPLLQASILLGGVISENTQTDWDVDEAVWYPASGTAGGGGGGGSPITDHDNLNGITTDNHHNKDHDHKGLGTIGSAPKIPHSDLDGIGANDHHNQQHEWNGTDHLNMPSTFPPSTHTHDHATLTNVLPDQHHAKSHAHNGSDGSGTVAHSATTGRTENDHHNKLHSITDKTHHTYPVANGYFLRDDGSWQPVGGGLTTVDLASVPTTTQVTITNTGGNDAIILDATTARAGVMTKVQVDKLNGIATGANYYVHPSYTARNPAIAPNALTGATVFSDMDLSFSCDDFGHITAGAFSYATRVMTLADLGYTGASNANYYVHPAYTPIDDWIITGALTGATVISDLVVNITSDAQGHLITNVLSYAVRQMTLANLGYTGDPNANNYVHPAYTARNADIDTLPMTGAKVISDLDMNLVSDSQGHVTGASFSVATRNLTTADIGAAKTSAGVVTPSFIGAATGGTVSGTLVWVTVGNLVMVTGQIKWTTPPTGTGQIRFGTLPYANDYETGFGFSGDKVQGEGGAANGNQVTMYAAAKDLRVWSINEAGNRQILTFNDMTTGGSINVNFSYYSSEVPA